MANGKLDEREKLVYKLRNTFNCVIFTVHNIHDITSRNILEDFSVIGIFFFSQHR